MDFFILILEFSLYSKITLIGANKINIKIVNNTVNVYNQAILLNPIPYYYTHLF